MPNPDIYGGAPGLGSTRETDFRRVFLGNEKYLAGSFVIDGANARDPLNTNRVFEIRAGLLLGRISASNKFGASVLGAVTEAYSDTDTSLTVSAATATELVRRIGESGTFRLVSAPANTGTVATDQVTYSAVNTSTGVITVEDIGKDAIVGSLLQPEDGSEAPLTILYDGYPKRVIDADLDDRDVELGRYPIGGVVDATQILNFPPAAATTLRQWVVDQLNAVGSFVFDYKHGL